MRNVAKEVQVRHKEYEGWIREQGAKFDKIRLKQFSPDYRGVMCSRKIRRGEAILFIPKHSMITVSMAQASPIGLQIQASGSSLIYPNNSHLAVFVLAEVAKGAQSKWRPFLEELPKSVDNFPLFFNPHELQLLTGSPFLGAVLCRSTC